MDINLSNFSIKDYLTDNVIPFEEKDQYYLLECPECKQSKSMMLNKERGYFLCVHANTCGVSGQLPKFLMICEGLSWKEAYQKITGNKWFTKTEVIHSRLEEFNVDNFVFEELIFPIYMKIIDRSTPKECIDYLEYRGIDQEMAQIFELRYFEFGKRLIFPIRNIDGMLVGYQARDITDTQDIKILTCPPNLKKSRLLYGWNECQNESEITLVEGPIDAIKCYQRNGVAILGAKISQHQINLLLQNKKLKRVNIGLDPDAKKMISETASILGNFFDVRIVELDQNKKDLGSCTVDEANYFIDKAVNFCDYSVI